MKTLYGIGSKCNICAGHGDYYDEISIRSIGAYGADGFPPLFTTEQAARDYIKQNRIYNGVPVPMIVSE